MKNMTFNKNIWSRMLIIYEISLVGNRMFTFIHYNLCVIKQKFKNLYTKNQMYNAISIKFNILWCYDQRGTIIFYDEMAIIRYKFDNKFGCRTHHCNL